MKSLIRFSQVPVVLSFFGLIAFCSSDVLAQAVVRTGEKDSIHEGDVREREEFYYDRLTSGDIKDVAEIRRRAIASFISMVRPAAFLEAQVPTWNSVGTNVGNYESGRVRSIAFDPQQPNALYIAATVGGLWKTDDISVTNVSWRCLSDNLPTSVCTAVAVPKTSANTIYLGTGETYPGYVASVGMGVFKSTDKGLNWQNVLAENRMGSTCSQIAVDPTDANNVFVAAPGDYYGIMSGITATHGLFHSTDGGSNWVNVGLPSGVYPVQVAIDPTDPTRVYSAGFAGEIYRSTDGGSTWIRTTPQYEFGKGKNPVLAIAPSSPNILYVSVARDLYYTSGGVYMSSDYGVNWTLVNDGAGNDATDPEMLSRQGYYGHAISVYETDPNALFMGGLEVYGSMDAGSTFGKYSNSRDYPDSNTYTHADIHALVAKDGNIYCGSDGGISIYTTAGGWNNKVNYGLPTLEFVNVDADEGLTRFIGGTQDNGTNLIQANQTTWATTHSGDGGNAWVSPVNPNIVYGTYVRTNIFRSDDGGFNWSDMNFMSSGLVTNSNLLNESAPFYAAYDASPDGSVVAFGGNAHVYVSIDGGLDGFAQSGQTTIGVSYSVLISPTNSAKMWAGSKSAIWRSNDMGLNWSRASVPATGNAVGIITGSNDSILYAVIGGLGGDGINHFVKSTDGGASWKRVANSFPSVPLNSIARSTSGQLFVGTDYGVITSSDDGVSWAPFGLGMPLVQVLSLKVKGSSTQYLLAGTHGRGAYIIQLTPLSVSASNAVTFKLNDVSPNPAIGSARASIGFEMDRDQEGTIALFDALGREVMTIAHERFSKGQHTIALPLSKLSSGDYFVALTSGGSTLSKKLVVAK